MHEKGEIDTVTYDYLDILNKQQHVAEMYHLAKVHKPFTELGTLNSRSILSGCGTPTLKKSKHWIGYLFLLDITYK